MHRPKLPATFTPQRWLGDDAVDCGPVRRFDAAEALLSMDVDGVRYLSAEVRRETGRDLDALALRAGLAGEGAHSGPFLVEVSSEDFVRFTATLGFTSEEADEPTDASLARIRAAYESMPVAPEDPSERVVGYQIVDADGANVHGAEEPFGLSTHAILVGQAAEKAREWTRDNPAYRIASVKDDVIEEPEYVGWIEDAPAIKVGP